ncbi:hypothetical protein AB0N14_38005 [Streptomyces sp. NPDC051104]|uniref:hypothetical protein n=1 Tax=Streptomyces sp. NPDC051104 TaxID=3155044 RepID=UPI00343E3A71
MDSLTGERGYCATVVRDLGPAEAVRRLGLPGDAVTRGTWTQLSACREFASDAIGGAWTIGTAVGAKQLILIGHTLEACSVAM